MSIPLDRQPLLEAREVARRLGLGLSTIRRLLRSGVLPHLRIGRAVRIREADLQAFIDARRGPGRG